MVKTKKNVTKVSENLSSESAPKKNTEEMRIYGFEDSMSVARTLFGSIHETLLHGDLIFAYRNTSTSNKKDLFQVVVVNDLVTNEQLGVYRAPSPFYTVSIITSGYTALLPHMPIGYLDEVASELEEGKVEKNIVANFREIINDQKEKHEININ